MSTPDLTVDPSALVAILQSEPSASDLMEVLTTAQRPAMTAANRVEFGMVVESRFTRSGRDFVAELLADAAIEIVPVDKDLADRALAAWRRFGKGRHHAGLNFGDCFSYALADRHDVPLLFVGEDFAATDVRPWA